MHDPRNEEDRLYQALKQAILEQRLTPGTRLREQQLAELFGVKRGRVRKVLTRLVQEQLVQHRPHAGAQVACPDLAETRDLFATRRILEGAVVERLAGRLSAADLQALRSHLERERQAYAQHRHREGLRQSVGFHVELARLSGNRVLQAFVEQILARTPLVLLAPGITARGCVNHDHGDIVDALEAGDGARARRCMEQHLNDLEQRFGEHEEGLTEDLEQRLFPRGDRHGDA